MICFVSTLIKAVVSILVQKESSKILVWLTGERLGLSAVRPTLPHLLRGLTNPALYNRNNYTYRQNNKGFRFREEGIYLPLSPSPANKSTTLFPFIPCGPGTQSSSTKFSSQNQFSLDLYILKDIVQHGVYVIHYIIYFVIRKKTTNSTD